MASKMCFLVKENTTYEEVVVDFTYIKGMAFSQKQKNVLSFHQSIKDNFPHANILEVSTKSDNHLGVALSAFNLKLNGKCIESIYQSAKVFSNGSHYPFLINYPPKDAHQYISEHANGELIKFNYENKDFPIKPKTFFYDYIYIQALTQIPQISSNLINYDIFTDIEFNEKKQINCQARACAIYCYLLRTNSVKKHLESLDNFMKIYSPTIQQLSFI